MKSFTIEHKEDRPPIEFSLTLPPLPDAAAPAAPKPRSRAKTKPADAPEAPAPRVETFRVRGFMPAWPIIEVEGLGSAGAQEGARRYLGFFDLALVDADRERFHEVVRDPRNCITSTELGEVFRWLYNVYTERPTPSA